MTPRSVSSSEVSPPLASQLPFSLYLHIPFCHHKCPYCDFNTYAVPQAPETQYIEALLSELDSRAALAEWKGRPIQTIFFGGGTPSLFSGAGIARILNAVAERFPVHADAEITMEANPGTVSFESLQQYRSAGVNRISLGAQSFQGAQLRALGRMHSPEQIESAVAMARDAGIENLNLDLIFGTPGQRVADCLADLNAALALKPEHISAYGLTIEKGTPFSSAFERGDLVLPPEEQVIEMMEGVCNTLSNAGVLRYEVSNFARAGYHCRHNLAYWNGDDYLGLGAGAHSFLSGFTPTGRRWSNYALPKKYMEEAVSSGNAEAWQDSLNAEELQFEFFFLGLRKTVGVALIDFETRYGAGALEPYRATIEMLQTQGLVQLSGSQLTLSERGIMLSDSVLQEFTGKQSR